jgi:RNA polymerase sigma-70 factor (ECF subfamily)
MPNSKYLVTEETIKRLKNGDVLAFDIIYRKYSPKLFGFILNILKVESDAEEIMQEVFLKIWEMRNEIGSYTSFNSFLYTITYNKSINLIRKKITERKYIDFLKTLPELTKPSVIDDLQFAELSAELKSLIEKLPLRQKEVFLLSRENELSYQEIADKLNISKNTVENHMVRALRFLKTNLKTLSLMHSLFLFLFLS